MPTPDRLPLIIARAWSGMLVVLLLMLMADTLTHAMTGRYLELSATLAHDPGPAGLWLLAGMACFNALFQVALAAWHGRGFRRFVFGASVVYTLFFVLHQAVHLAQGEAPGLHTLLDLSHHTLGATACWASWRWLRAAG